jgi:hypothetical protein
MSSATNLQKAVETATANGAAFKSLYEISLNTVQKIYSRNSEFIRAFAEAGAYRKGGLDLRDLAGTYAQYLERSSEYFSEIGDICTTTQTELLKVGAQNAEDLAKNFIAEFEALLQQNPLDNAKFSDWLTSALSTAGTTYEKIVDTSRQITESSLTVATHLGQAAANTATKTARKTA